MELKKENSPGKRDTQAIKNPYVYLGPLDPENDVLVCIPRESEVNKVIAGIERGDYWSILGPRQIGKTTFLRLLMEKLSPSCHTIFLNLEVAYDKKSLFRELIKQINDKKISKQNIDEKIITNEYPDLDFFRFLENFVPKDDNRIVFIFDEIDGMPYLKEFLQLWRKVFSERQWNNNLKKYIVITAGAEELVKLTMGPTSPFVTQTLLLSDFKEKESMQLLKKLFDIIETHPNGSFLSKMNNKKKIGKLEITKEAANFLLEQLDGHPQMFQHACYLLVEQAISTSKPIVEQDVENAIETLFLENTSLETLKASIEKNEKLKELVIDILNGEKRKFFSVKEFALLGSGAIKEADSYCKIRNEVYERAIEDILKIQQIKRGQEEITLISRLIAIFFPPFDAVVHIFKYIRDKFKKKKKQSKHSIKNKRGKRRKKNEMENHRK